MSDDNGSPNPGSTKSSLNELIGRILSEYPRLALPVAVVAGLLGLVAMCKTLVEVFVWAYKGWEFYGVLLVALAVVAVSVAAILLVDAAIAPRPKIQTLPTHYLSRSPRINWEYKDNPLQPASYEVRVTFLETGETRLIPVPQRMHQIGFAGITGALEVSVDALVAGKKVRRSMPPVIRMKPEVKMPPRNRFISPPCMNRLAFLAVIRES